MKPGWVSPEVAAEFPDLRLFSVEVGRPAPPAGRSPPEVRERLRALSDRIRGAEAMLLRTRPVAHAHRVFYRHIGIDPDETRVPVEAVVFDRLRDGRLRSRSLLDDAIAIAVLETGIGLWALDADRVEGELGIAPAEGGRLAVCDTTGAVAPLFGEPDGARAATSATARLLVYAVEVPGVPAMYVEEALWIAGEMLGEP